LLLSACTEFATPAELDRPQILAITTQPPSVGLGERSTIDLLVADPSGEVSDARVTWASVAIVEGTLPVGDVEVADDGTVSYIAPSERPETMPTIAMVQASVEIADQTLVGIKAVVVGNVGLANPTLIALSGNATDLLANPELTLSRDEIASLSVTIEPAATDETMYAWYSTIGTIEMYRSSPTEIVADTPGQGWLFLVVRDGRGGVIWHKVHLTVSDTEYSP
jgi:hypothetical protein